MSKSRTLHLTSPHLHGSDVERFQQDLNNRAKSRGVKPVHVDGDYGPATRALFLLIVRLLGLNVQVAEAKGATPYTRTLIRHPALRNPAQLARAAKAAAAFKKERARARRGPAAAIAAARKCLGWHEVSANQAPFLLKWAKAGNVAWMYASRSPWCGLAVWRWLSQAGVKVNASRCVYTPNILHDARAGINGWEKLVPWSQRQPGDAVLYKWPGVSRDEVDHVGLYAGPGDDTIEGNTSPDSGGSQNNGGGVYHKNRNGYGVVGCARPRW